MKRILAMLLAALMLLSCTALAEVVPVSDGRAKIKWVDVPDVVEGETDADITDNSKLDINKKHTSRYKEEDGLEGAVKTELWLEVDNSGQIDVTVPLVLVFSTNVDGGTATAPDNYRIYNNNERNSIAVDKIVVEEKSKDLMTFVTSGNFDRLNPNERDFYSVVLNPQIAAEDKTTKSRYSNLDMNTQLHTKVYDLRSAVGTTIYDKTNETDKALMTLGQSGIINLMPTMKTTPLTFVTTDYKGNANTATTGVHLITVTYTVGLQYTNNVGDPITDKDDNANVWADDYLNPTNP